MSSVLKTKFVRSTLSVESCILTGGLSSRMGRDKSKLRLGERTLLAHIRKAAKVLGFPVRIIRRDLVPRCGPLGGIYTALKTTSADAVLFLACDMPQVSPALLAELLERFQPRDKAVFTWNNDMAGFPFLLNRSALPIVEQLLVEKNYSMQFLFRETRAKKFRAARTFKSEMANINTPEDWKNLKHSIRND